MNDQAMLDHLVRKYGANSLINILQKTTQNGVASSSSSTVSASTSSARHNSVASKLSTGHSSMPSPAPSISDASSLYSERSGSDTSSIYSTNSHMTSTSSLYQRPPIAKKSSRGLNRVQPHTSYPSQLQPSPKKAPFECPFCFEGNISVEIARKSDLKRHFNNFHHTDALWQCSIRGCNMLFDWKAGFDAHVKESHQGIHRSNEDNMLKLCPQVVFACGFDNCKKVYEAESDEDAAAKVEEYHKHVADHFDSGATHKDWSHSVRFRNLMRIAPVDKAWKGRPRSRDASSASWLPQPTLVLRKLLETRHVIDLNLFVRWAATLGSAPFNTLQTAIPKLPSELTIPLRDACRLGPGGHKPYVDPAVEHTNGIDGMESSEEKTVVEVFTGTSSHATPRPQTSQTMSPPAILPRDFQSQPIATSTYLKADPEMNGSNPLTVTPPYVTSQPDMTAVTTSPQCTIPEEHGFVGQPDNSFWFYNGFTAPMPDMGGQGGMPIMHDMDKRMHEQPHMGDQSTIRPHNQSQMDTDGMMMHGYHNMNGGRDIDMSDYATSSPQNSFMI